MITVTPASYKAIEDALEDHWNTLPWRRIFTDGKRGGYEEVIKRFDLVCTEQGDCVNVKMVSKENPSNITFDQTFLRFM